VEALVRLQSCPSARGKIFNVGSTEEITILHLAKEVIRILGSLSRIEFVPYDQAYEPGFEDMRRRKPVIERLAAYTAFRPSTRLDRIIELTAAATG
jgi:UDP-glucose 4-epimerase